MGTTGKNAGGTAAVSTPERELDTSLTKRQLKMHVTSALKASNLQKAETYSTSIRGFREVKKHGFAWGEEYDGANPPNIVYIGGYRASVGSADSYLDKVEQALKDDFKIYRTGYSIEILGEYKKEEK